MKSIVSVIAVLLVLSLQASAGTLTFFNYWDYVYKAAGAGKVALADGYTIKLMQDVSKDGVDAYGVDEVQLFSSTTSWNGSSPGNFSDVTGDVVNNGDAVFVRVLNSGSTAYVNLDANEGTGSFEETYTVNLVGGMDSHRWGGSDPTGSDWQPVPEPASLALFGIGVAVVAIRRRMAKK